MRFLSFSRFPIDSGRGPDQIKTRGGWARCRVVSGFEVRISPCRTLHVVPRKRDIRHQAIPIAFCDPEPAPQERPDAPVIVPLPLVALEGEVHIAEGNLPGQSSKERKGSGRRCGLGSASNPTKGAQFLRLIPCLPPVVAGSWLRPLARPLEAAPTAAEGSWSSGWWAAPSGGSSPSPG